MQFWQRKKKFATIIFSLQIENLLQIRVGMLIGWREANTHDLEGWSNWHVSSSIGSGILCSFMKYYRAAPIWSWVITRSFRVHKDRVMIHRRPHFRRAGRWSGHEEISGWIVPPVCTSTNSPLKFFSHGWININVVLSIESVQLVSWVGMKVNWMSGVVYIYTH